MDAFKQLYKDVDARVVNADSDLSELGDDKYNIIIHWGLLYHLENVEENMKAACERCDIMFLESELFDGSECYIDAHNLRQDGGADKSLTSLARPFTASYVEKLLE